MWTKTDNAGWKQNKLLKTRGKPRVLLYDKEIVRTMLGDRDSKLVYLNLKKLHFMEDLAVNELFVTILSLFLCIRVHIYTMLPNNLLYWCYLTGLFQELNLFHALIGLSTAIATHGSWYYTINVFLYLTRLKVKHFS